MSNDKKKTTTAQNNETAPVNKGRKPNSGQFKKGNTIGMETRFQKGHDVTCKYDEKYCEELISFFSDVKPEIIYEECYYPDGTVKARRPASVIPAQLPTFEGFAWKIGVTVGTLLNWRDKYPHFANAYTRAIEKQKEILLINGANKQYDGNFAKFLLMNNHGMSEKQMSENTFKIVYDNKSSIDEESD